MNKIIIVGFSACGKNFYYTEVNKLEVEFENALYQGVKVFSRNAFINHNDFEVLAEKILKAYKAMNMRMAEDYWEGDDNDGYQNSDEFKEFKETKYPDEIKEISIIQVLGWKEHRPLMFILPTSYKLHKRTYTKGINHEDC